MNKDKHTANESSFADMFESSLAKMDRLQPGQLVESEVVAISKEYIFLQLSGKSEGVLDRAELTDADGQLKVREGDVIKAYFLHSRQGELVFTTRLGGDKLNTGMLENAWQNKIPVEGVVDKEIKGGYEVRIGNARAFCPYSQMGLKRADSADAWVGKTLSFVIQEYKENGRRVVVSNRVIEEAARQDQLEQLKQTLSEGQVVRGTVLQLQEFGAFVDLQGFQALLPVSEIARERVTDIASVLSVGQEIEAEILSIDWKRERISLSMKNLLADPWDDAAARYAVDSRHTGKVVRIAEFGVFVALEPGLDGLVHVSELRSGGKPVRPKDAAKIGQAMSVQVLAVDPANRRIALKPVTLVEEEAETRQFISGDDKDEGYNPFAQLLKKR